MNECRPGAALNFTALPCLAASISGGRGKRVLKFGGSPRASRPPMRPPDTNAADPSANCLRVSIGRGATLAIQLPLLAVGLVKLRRLMGLPERPRITDQVSSIAGQCRASQ